MEKYDRFSCPEGYQMVCIEGKYTRCICESISSTDAILPVKSRSWLWMEPL